MGRSCLYICVTYALRFDRYDDDGGDEIEEAKTLRRMQALEVEDGADSEVSEDEELFSHNNNADGNHNAEDDAIDEEEDIQRREEELQAELNFATLRCQELHRTLQETKSFIDANPDNRPIRPAANKIVSTIESTNEVESDYEDNFDMDESTELNVSSC
jgi:hypothetical protein